MTITFMFNSLKHAFVEMYMSISILMAYLSISILMIYAIIFCNHIQHVFSLLFVRVKQNEESVKFIKKKINK